jgi:hypothetical protein
VDSIILISLGNLLDIQMIRDLTAMMLERLQAYKAKSKAFPERVYVYRDGVSEVSILDSDLTASK